MISSQNIPNRWGKLKDIFTKVAELPPDARRAYLSILRVNEKTLSEEVSELIELDEESPDFLQIPLQVNFELFPLQSLLGAKIGNYQIVSEIGRGGMGAVFEAVRRDGEFEQRVAIKLTNHGFLSDEFGRRFRRERQILANLEHPNIVRLFDGGIWAGQIPYFAMEFIEGVSLNHYCYKKDVSLEERLDIFLQICEAVQYAHQQLIVHCDLKPGNILITSNGQVKLLDFGIARTLDKSLEGQTLTRNTPLTLAYASPEQIKRESLSTLTDIYSLGIILYELLTGRSPFQIYQATEFDLPRAICEDVPLRPSLLSTEKLQKKGVTQSEALKATSRKQESRKLKGDLDNIILKAISKEPQLRYASAQQFADDIKSYLKGLPVKAHPQSFTYHARKFLKRNRLSVFLAAMALLLILGSMTFALWQLSEAKKQQQIAEQRFYQVRKIANSLIFDYHDKLAVLPGSTQLREKLVSDAVGYLDTLTQNSENNADLQKETAVAYRKIGDAQGMAYSANLGKSDEALKSYQKSVSLLENIVSSNSADNSLQVELIKSDRALAAALIREGDKLNARAILHQAIGIAKKIIQRSENNVAEKILLIRLQITLADTGLNISENLAIYQKILNDTQDLFAVYPNNSEIVYLLAMLHQRVGSNYRWLGEDEEKRNNKILAGELFRQSIEHAFQTIHYDNLSGTLTGNTNNRQTADSYLNLAANLMNIGKFDEALKNTEIADEYIQKIKVIDPGNKEILLDELQVYNNKQKILMQAKKFTAALKLIQTALEIAQNCYRNDPTNVEALSWTGHFSIEAANLSAKLNKTGQAANYLNLYKDYARINKERTGNDWSGNFNF